MNRIAISTDGSTIVSCWYNTLSHNTIKVVVHDVGSSTPLWIYDYPTSSGTYQEGCHDIDITDDGAYFIVGSLGDDANINPEVHIFQRDATPHVYYTVDMPGSMFSVDIKGDGSYATAAGKHIHANAMGRGGDIVMIDTDITGIKDTETSHLGVEPLSLDIYPNPFTQKTDIRYQMTDNSGERTLKIYDVSGKMIKSISELSSVIGHQLSVKWDGTDYANRQLASGVYFVRLETNGQTLTKKIVKLE